MGESRTTITQPFTISLDLDDLFYVLKEKLHEAISLSDKNIHDVCIDDWDYDDGYLTFKGSYQAGANTWYYKQTMEEPEDYGYEPDTTLSKNSISAELKEQLERCVSVTPEKDMCFCIRNTFAKNIKVATVDDSEEPDFPDEEDYGPDPDRAYDEWKDRQFEEY